jgi:hypothetical protein
MADVEKPRCKFTLILTLGLKAHVLAQMEHLYVSPQG